MNEEQTKQQFEIIQRLKGREEFKLWINIIVEPLIAQLEASLSSEEADKMPESILRAKLKHVNSLKYLFNDVFAQMAMAVEEEKVDKDEGVA